MTADKEIRKKIGIINYAKLQQAINKANNLKTKVYHVTKNKKTLENKELIQKTHPNIQIMTETEWLEFSFKKLSPEEQKKVKDKILKEMERIKK